VGEDVGDAVCLQGGGDVEIEGQKSSQFIKARRAWAEKGFATNSPN
jgi:hypothetical protein